MPASLLFDFRPPDPDPASDWRSVDDVVMGGVSNSSFVATNEGAAFTGTVSLEQGGGFASVRSPQGPWDLSGAEGLTMRLSGDEKRYWITVYGENTGSLSYRAPVAPSETWTTVVASFDTLKAYRRGRRRPDAPPLDRSQIRAIGFLIADEQAGPFHLNVEWIGVTADAGAPDTAENAASTR